MAVVVGVAAPPEPGVVCRVEGRRARSWLMAGSILVVANRPFPDHQD